MIAMSELVCQAPYTETLTNYVRFQQLVAPNARYVAERTILVASGRN